MSITYFDKESLDRWFVDEGDKNHRLNYDLNENSIIFDVGGYEGDWANDVFDKFGCYIYVFEPVKKYYEYIVNRFRNNDKVKVFNVALSNIDGDASITHNTASSSMFIDGLNKEDIKLKNLNTFLNEEKLNDKNIDLIKINIEGGEYDLLDNMIECGSHKKFNDIQIQFHKNIIPDWDNRRNYIREELIKTHELTYDYSFVWENWEINK